MFWQYFIASMVVLIVTYVAYVYFYRSKFISLSETLYMKGDASKYLEEIDKFPSTIFFPKKLRDMMKIDAYMMLNEDSKLESLFETLNNTSLRYADEFIVHQKEISYYSSKRNVEKAKEAYEKMKVARTKIKAKSYETYDNALREVEYMIALLDKDGRFAKELANKGVEAGETMIAGTYFYKAAQSYYFQDDLKNAKYFLEKALKYLKGTNYEEKIKTMINTNNFKSLGE